MARKEKFMTEWIPSSHLTFHEVRGNRPCFRLKMVSKDGWSSSMRNVVVDVVDGLIQVTGGDEDVTVPK
jgi:hypothetical protein